MNIYLAEFVGTAVLIFIGDGINAGLSLNKSYAKDSGWIVTTVGWGLAVTFGIYAVGIHSGAHINPAVTLGFAAVGQFPWQQVPGYIIAQVLGAMFGAMLVWLQYLPHWKETMVQETKLGVFSTGPAIQSRFSNLLSELLGAFVLLFGLSFLGANEFSKGLNPLVVGALIVVIGMAFGGTTGYAINPARDLGPRLAHFLLPIAGKGDSNWPYSWIPVVGPLIGGILGTSLYIAIIDQSFNTGLMVSGIFTLIIVVLAIREQK